MSSTYRLVVVIVMKLLMFKTTSK